MFMCDSVPSDPRVWFSWNSADGRLDEAFSTVRPRLQRGSRPPANRDANLLDKTLSCQANRGSSERLFTHFPRMGVSGSCA